VRPAVDDPVGRDFGAKVPPGQAFGLVGLDWLRTVMRASEYRGVFETAVEKALYGLPRCPGAGVGAAPNVSRSSGRKLPAVSAAPESAMPQLRCSAVWRSRIRPPPAITRSSYQRPFSNGAATSMRASPSSRRAPSAATESAGPPSIASTVCGRPSSSHGWTRTTIVHGSGNASGSAGTTTPHDPRWTGWKRDA